MEFLVSEKETGQTLLAFLKQKLSSKYSSRAIKRSIEKNGCQINERVERFSNTSLGNGDRIQFILVEERSIVFSLDDILYEDEEILVYNKPSGINCDQKGIIKLLEKHCFHLILVHRLDRDTSGVLLLAKTPQSEKTLCKQFKQRIVKKTYLAVVDGVPSKERGVIKNQLVKKKEYAGQTIWGSSKDGKGLFAETKWECIKKAKNKALIRCFPKTGRTHQIRVHLSELSHPILGDYQYGRNRKIKEHPSRLLLHAQKLQFLHPITQKEMVVEAETPEEFHLK